MIKHRLTRALLRDEIQKTRRFHRLFGTKTRLSSIHRWLDHQWLIILENFHPRKQLLLIFLNTALWFFFCLSPRFKSNATMALFQRPDSDVMVP